jgi:tetratricopeptide (TPR) repeat protein
LTEAGRAREAVARLDAEAQAADADPQIVAAFALALAKLQRYDDAVAASASARQRNPRSPALLVELGTVQLMANRRAAARAAFEEAVRINPADARAHSLGARRRRRSRRRGLRAPAARRRRRSQGARRCSRSA